MTAQQSTNSAGQESAASSGSKDGQPDDWDPDWEHVARKHVSQELLAQSEEVYEQSIYDFCSAIRSGDREEIEEAASLTKTRLKEMADAIDHHLEHDLNIDPPEPAERSLEEGKGVVDASED